MLNCVITKKTYKNYNVNLRVIEDAMLIQLIEDEKAKGTNTTEAFRNLLKKTIIKILRNRLTYYTGGQ